MPTVPTYEESVGWGGGMSGRQDVQAPQGAFGIDPGGVQAVASGLSDQADVQQKLDAQHDEAVGKFGVLNSTTFRNQTFYGDDKTAGYLSLREQDAVQARPGVIESLRKNRDEIIAKLGQTPRQKALLTQVLGQQFEADVHTIGVHATAQGLAWGKTQSAATETIDRQSAINATVAALTAGDPGTAAAQQHEAAKFRAKLGLEVTRNLQTTGSLSPETYQAAMGVHATKLHSAVVDNLLGMHSAASVHQADVYMQMNQGEMEPEARASYMARVHDAVTAQGAEDAASAGAAMHTPPAISPEQAAAGSVPGSAPAPLKASAVTPYVRGLLVKAGATAAEQETLIRIQQHENHTANPTLKNPLPGATSYGIWQFVDQTWRAMGGTGSAAGGGGDRSDPQAQANAALKLMRQNGAGLRLALGRDASPSELYIAHQQGLGAARALLTADPNANAIEVLKAAHVKGATSSILNNLPKSQRPVGAATTVGQFLTSWGVQNTAMLAGRATAAAPVAQPGAASALPDKESMVAEAVAHAPPGADAATVGKFRQAGEAHFNRLKSAFDAQHTAADEQIDMLFASKTPPKAITEIPPAILSAASPSKQRSTYAALAKTEDGSIHPKQSDPQTLADMSYAYGHSDPRFAKMDLMSSASKLSAGDFQKVLGWQRDALTPEKAAKQTTLRTAMGIASTQLNAAGFDARHHAKERAQFQTSLQNDMDAWRVQYGKEPDEKTINQLSDMLLLHGTWKGEPGLFGAKTVNDYRFKAPTGVGVATVVPARARDKITSDFKTRFKREPSAHEVEVAYQQAHAAGILQ